MVKVPDFRRPINNQSGVALLMALFAMVIMMIIAVELTYETNVDYQVASQQLNRLKAYYGARAGLDIGLLRVKIYQKIMGFLRGADKQIQSAVPLATVDLVWQFPFSWPPPISADMNGIDKGNFQKAVKESLMQAQYSIKIQSESGKIDINDLASPSKLLAQATRDQILKVFRQRVENDEDFGRRYRTYRFEELVNNITDWIDDDNESLNGGDERGVYEKAKDGQRMLPPNQPFKTFQELHMVAGMTDELFDTLLGYCTIFGVKGINVNYAGQTALMSLNPRMTPEIVQDIFKRRNDPGPFKDKDEFFTYLRGKGIDTRELEKDEAIPLYFDPEYIFRVTSTGTFGKSAREIVAIVYDFDRVKENLGKALAKGNNQQQQQPPPNQPNPQQPPQQPGQTQQPNQSQNATNTPKKGRPNIVYWQED